MTHCGCIIRPGPQGGFLFKLQADDGVIMCGPDRWNRGARNWLAIVLQ